MTIATPTVPPNSAAAARGAGLALIISTVLGILVLSHHPGIAFSELVQGGEAARRLAVASAWVHGILMVWLVVGYYCLLEFAVQRDLRRPSVRIGLVVYSVGVLAMLGAATIDGFVTSQVPLTVTRIAAAGLLPEPTTIRQLVLLASALNQALANVGAVGMSLGISAWSCALLRGGRYEKAIGAGGVLIGIASIVALVAGVLVLSRHGILVLEAAQAVWTLAIGVLLMRTRRG